MWMLHSRQNNNKIKHLHERCLRLIHNDKLSSYEELLEKNLSVSIHNSIFLHIHHSITISDKIEILGYAL